MTTTIIIGKLLSSHHRTDWLLRGYFSINSWYETFMLYIDQNSLVWRTIISIHYKTWQIWSVKNVPYICHVGLWFFCMISCVYIICLSYTCHINSLWPGDAIWRHGTRSTLAQVMSCCLTAPSHYLNHWTSVDLSSVRSSDIHLRASSPETPQPSITEIIRKIKYLKFHSNLLGANDSRYCTSDYFHNSNSA